MRTGFWWGNLRKRCHLGDLGLDGSVILKGILNKSMGQMVWIDLAQDRYKCQAVVKAVMNIQVT
jgi:hypothetical protein